MNQVKMLGTMSLCMVLGLAGCPVEDMQELEVVCDEAILSELGECFEQAWIDRAICWSDVTGDDSFSGYFSDIYDRRELAKWKGLWEPWLECGEEFDLQLGNCLAVAPRIEAPEVWAPDPYKQCLEPPKNHWGHPVARPCLTIEYEVASACIGHANAVLSGAAWSDAVDACHEAHFDRQEECLYEEDARQQDCFINISDIAICEYE